MAKGTVNVAAQCSSLIAKIEAESDKLRAKIDGAKAPKKPAAKKTTAKKAAKAE